MMFIVNSSRIVEKSGSVGPGTSDPAAAEPCDPLMRLLVEVAKIIRALHPQLRIEIIQAMIRF